MEDELSKLFGSILAEAEKATAEEKRRVAKTAKKPAKSSSKRQKVNPPPPPVVRLSPDRQQPTRGTGEKDPSLIVSRLPVSITGTRPGEKLKAFKGKFKGMILEILDVENDQHQIPPLRVRVEEVEQSQLLPQLLPKLRALPFFSSMSTQDIRLWLSRNAAGSDTSATEKTRNMTDLRVRVLDAGPSPDYAKLAPEILQQASQEGISTLVIAEAMKTANNLKKSPLVFFSDYWSICQPVSQGSRVPANCLVIDLLSSETRVLTRPEDLPAGQTLLPVQIPNQSDIFIVVPSFSPAITSLENSALQAAFAALSNTTGSFPSLDAFRLAYEEFRRLHLPSLQTAGLKSLLQKLIRYSPDRVSYSLVPGGKSAVNPTQRASPVTPLVA